MLAPGAGHGDEGDASFQGPAQDKDLPASPKPANPDGKVAASDEAPKDVGSSVIELAAVTIKLKAAEVAVPREGGGLVTVRAKPEKRKNAKERTKERVLEKYAAKDTAKDGTTPDTTAKAKSKAEKKAKSEVKSEVKAKKSKRAGKAALSAA
jgi:hypothetical protein